MRIKYILKLVKMKYSLVSESILLIGVHILHIQSLTFPPRVYSAQYFTQKFILSIVLGCIILASFNPYILTIKNSDLHKRMHELLACFILIFISLLGYDFHIA